MKKIMLAVAVMFCLALSAMPAWANTQETVKVEPEVSLPYINADSISSNFAVRSGTAYCSVDMPLKRGSDVDYAQITAYIKKSSGTSVKTYSEKMSVLGTRHSWDSTYKLPSRGSYYMSVVVKCYKAGKVTETITTTSNHATY